MAALYVKALTGLLIVFFLSGIRLISSQRVMPSLFITTPKTMRALSGSCVQIPCNFSTREEVSLKKAETFRVWMKDEHAFAGRPEIVIFNSSQTVNLYQGEITGDLRKKDCTTVFYNLTTDHAASYYFRVENSPYKATAIDDPIEITVDELPPSPNTSSNISSAQVKAGDIATFTCSAIAPCPTSPPVLKWNPSIRDAERETQSEENADRTVIVRSQMTLTLAAEHDGVNVSCSVHYPVNNFKFKTTNKTLLRLDVSYPPRWTSASISPADLVSVGSCVNLTCISTAKPAVHSFIWFKASQHGPTNVSVGEFYSFNVSSAADGGAYYCEARNGLGTQASSEIHLRIEENPQPDYPVSSQAIIGAITGLTLTICLVVFIWWLRRRRSAVPRQTQQSELVGVGDEDIHYGEIDFSKLQIYRSGSERVTEPEPETEYAEVKAGQLVHTSSNVTETGNERDDDLYAQVKKH